MRKLKRHSGEETRQVRKSIGRKRKILLVDDHPILRESFGELINMERDLQASGQADDAMGALHEIMAQQPHLVVVDIELKKSNGFELIKSIKTLHPHLPILALSVHDEALYAERALRAGAWGYVMKQSSIEEVMGAMREVLKGLHYVSPKIQERMSELISNFPRTTSASGLRRLNERELEIIQLMGNGARTREIATRLSLKVRTVENCRAQIMEKLKLRDAMELIRYAVNAAGGYAVGV